MLDLQLVGDYGEQPAVGGGLCGGLCGMQTNPIKQLKMNPPWLNQHMHDSFCTVSTESSSWVQAHAWTALGKLCLADEALAKKCVHLFVQQLDRASSPAVRPKPSTITLNPRKQFLNPRCAAGLVDALHRGLPLVPIQRPWSWHIMAVFSWVQVIISMVVFGRAGRLSSPDWLVPQVL